VGLVYFGVADFAVAGDDFGDVLYLDDESPWSLSLVLVLPLAPLNP